MKNFFRQIEFPVSDRDVADKIIAIDRDFFSFPWSDELWTKLFLSKGENSLLAISTNEHGEIIGFLLFHLSHEESLAHLLKIVVMPECRKSGVGTFLLKTALDMLVVFNRFYLEVEKDNLAALRCYSSLGFKEISLKKKFYSNGSDARIMVLNR